MKRMPRGSILLLLVAVSWAGCKRPEPYSRTGPPEVTVARPGEEKVAPEIDLTGTVAPTQSVDLVARVEGVLQKIFFQDGAFVKKGDQLFLIEQDIYEQKVALYEAQEKAAQAEYARQSQLVKQNATSQANLDKALADRDQAAANLAIAKIQLGYTVVSAPFDGRMSAHLVDVGNVVGSGGSPTKLATIEELVPCYLNFSVSTRDALRLRKIAQKLGVTANEKKVPVFAGLEDEKGYPHQGLLDFANSNVDSATGTVALRAIFPNDDHILFSGLFARVRIPLGPPAATLVVPNTAISNDQVGDYLLVVNAQDMAERRNVTLGERAGQMRAVTSGLTENDRVIVSGQAAIRPGEKVTPHEASAPSPPASPEK